MKRKLETYSTNEFRDEYNKREVVHTNYKKDYIGFLVTGTFGLIFAFSFGVNLNDITNLKITNFWLVFASGLSLFILLILKHDPKNKETIILEGRVK